MYTYMSSMSSLKAPASTIAKGSPFARHRHSAAAGAALPRLLRLRRLLLAAASASVLDSVAVLQVPLPLLESSQLMSSEPSVQLLTLIAPCSVSFFEALARAARISTIIRCIAVVTTIVWCLRVPSALMHLLTAPATASASAWSLPYLSRPCTRPLTASSAEACPLTFEILKLSGGRWLSNLSSDRHASACRICLPLAVQLAALHFGKCSVTPLLRWPRTRCLSALPRA